MQITIAWIEMPAGHGCTKTIEVPEGTTVQDALDRAGLTEPHGCAIFNDECEPERTLIDGERIDILQPLVLDPKEARGIRAETRRAAANRTWGRHGGRHQLHHVS